MNVNQQEIDKFSAFSTHWWDRYGALKTLHDINPLRLEWISQQTHGLAGKKVLDVGCGGGILSESMAHQKAIVTGIDMAQSSLEVARQHALQSGVHIDYQCIAAESLAASQPHQYDIVTCMEMLEHVPDPYAVIQSCQTLVKPGGLVFFSTLNRNLKSFLLAIVGAEYLLRMLPVGTHDYNTFIQPSELIAMARQTGLDPIAMKGISYSALSDLYSLSDNTSVNYMLVCHARSL